MHVILLLLAQLAAGLFGAPVSLLMYIWFYKDTVVEYLHLLKLDRFFYVQEFLISAKDDPALTYQKFLMYNVDSFFVRMLSCPVCLSVWLSIGIDLLLYITTNTSLCWLPALALTTAYVSLFSYSKLVKLMEHEK